MNKFQKDVSEWADETFPNSNPEIILNHLKGPNGEIQELITDDDPMEAADCWLLLLHFCSHRGWDIDQIPSVEFRWLANTVLCTSSMQALVNIEELSNSLTPDAEQEDVAKLMVLLSYYCAMKGKILEHLAEEKHDINKKRVWGTPDPVTGVVRHVEE